MLLDLFGFSLFPWLGRAAKSADDSEKLISVNTLNQA
jgi:hypothetical protein